LIYGYNGKIAHIDLSTSTVTVEEPTEEFYRTYLGGWGFIIYYLLRETPRGVDPLGPENRLIFATGPVTRGLSLQQCNALASGNFCFFGLAHDASLLFRKRRRHRLSR